MTKKDPNSGGDCAAGSLLACRCSRKTRDRHKHAYRQRRTYYADAGAMFSEGQEGQLLGRTQRILLEICTILYFFAKNSAIPLVQQYVYRLVAKKYNFTTALEEELRPILQSLPANMSNYTEHMEPEERDSLVASVLLAHKVNEESSLIVLYLNIAELLPCAVTVLFLGWWSDVTGRRKFLMWLPCLGNAVYALGFLLPIYINGGDIDHPATKTLFVLACLCSGLSGTVPGYLSGNASYISDTDTPGRRTLRLAIVEMSIGVTFGLANLINGFWVDVTAHFDQPLWFIFVCSMLPFLILLLLLKEPNGEVLSQLGQPTTFRDFRGIKHVFGCKTIAQKKLWAVFFAFQVYVFVQQGQERTFVLFLQNYPLYWQSVKIGLFFFVLYTLSGLGAWPGVPLMMRHFDEILIALIAMVSKMVGSLIMAFAKTDPLVYISSIVQLFHLTPYAVARSVASRQVGEDEQGSVYALLHSVQAVMAFVGPVAHNAIFAATLRYDNGLVFLISGPLLIVPIVLLTWMKYLNKVEQGYMTMDGSEPPKALTPTMTPLSETAGFAQRATTFGSTHAHEVDGAEEES